jgi:RNA polymerase sigma factor (sigma-70 family)
MTRWRRCSDAELLAATASQPEAFAEFYLRYERPVLAYLHRRVRDPQVVSDLLAEVFAAALAGAARFDPARAGGDAAFAWLFAIARNTLSSSVERGRVADEARRGLAMLEPLVMTDDGLERVENAAANAALDIERLLQTLPREQRQAVIARVLDERDYAEIAGELECSSLVVRKRVSRGLATLRAHLTAHPSSAEESR